MATPAFFDQAPPIPMRDPLAAFLGAADDGLLTTTTSMRCGWPAIPVPPSPARI